MHLDPGFVEFTHFKEDFVLAFAHILINDKSLDILDNSLTMNRSILQFFFHISTVQTLCIKRLRRIASRATWDICFLAKMFDRLHRPLKIFRSLRNSVTILLSHNILHDRAQLS